MLTVFVFLKILRVLYDFKTVWILRIECPIDSNLSPKITTLNLIMLQLTSNLSTGLCRLLRLQCIVILRKYKFGYSKFALLRCKKQCYIFRS